MPGANSHYMLGYLQGLIKKSYWQLSKTYAFRRFSGDRETLAAGTRRP